MKTVHLVIGFNKKAWLKPYIDMNADLRKAAKIDFEKYFLKMMNNSAFGKTMENVQRHKVTKLITIEKRRNYLASEPNYHAIKFLTENLLPIEMRKTQILKNKSFYLGLSILDLHKTIMYRFGMIM